MEENRCAKKILLGNLISQFRFLKKVLAPLCILYGRSRLALVLYTGLLVTCHWKYGRREGGGSFCLKSRFSVPSYCPCQPDCTDYYCSIHYLVHVKNCGELGKSEIICHNTLINENLHCCVNCFKFYRQKLCVFFLPAFAYKI